MRAMTLLMVVMLVLACAGIAQAESAGKRACKEQNLGTDTGGISGNANWVKVSLDYSKAGLCCREKSTTSFSHVNLDKKYMQTCLCYAWLMSKWYPNDSQYTEAVTWYSNQLVAGALADGFKCTISVDKKAVKKENKVVLFTVSGVVAPGVKTVQVQSSLFGVQSATPGADGSYAMTFSGFIESKIDDESIRFEITSPEVCKGTEITAKLITPEPEGSVTSVKFNCEPEIQVSKEETKTFTIEAKGSGPMTGKFFKDSVPVGSVSSNEANIGSIYLFHKNFTFENGGGYYSASVTDESGITMSAGNGCHVEVIPAITHTDTRCKRKYSGSGWYADIKIQVSLFNPDSVFLHGKLLVDGKVADEHFGADLATIQLKYTHNKPNTHIRAQAFVEYTMTGTGTQKCLKNGKVWSPRGLVPKRPSRIGNQAIGPLYLSDDLMCEICEECDDSFSDVDKDGIEDGVDNCLKTPNPQQGDSDADRIGNACDNCPGIPNSGQEDADGDGLGDKCDYCPDDPAGGETDSDGDGRGDECDNCSQDFNPDQADNDEDGLGNPCDNCLDDSNADQLDSDGNGVGDACEEDLCVPPDCCPDYPEPCDGVCWEVCPAGYEPDPSDCSLCVEEPCVPPACCPEYPQICGAYCIPAGTKCCDPGTGGWCAGNEECCGSRCMPAGAWCCEDGSHCTSGPCCGTGCCPSPEQGFCCGGSVCCFTKDDCCFEKTGIAGCCAGGNCCPDGRCCPPGEECCGGGCCKPGSMCIGGECVAI